MKNPLYLILLLCLCSCKTMNIFQVDKKEDSGTSFKLLTKEYEHQLKPDDKLSISIWNHDDLSVGSVFSIYNTNESFGKWVLIEKDSTAAIPSVGAVKIGGLTLTEAEKIVSEKVGKYVKNPIVEIRVLNREVTILGEVNAPGNYLLEKELNTLVEYLGKAQGLGFYADTERIQIIRDEVSHAVDLTYLASFASKNIYLQSGDIIYIPSKKGKRLDLKAPVLIPFASLLTSVGVLISVVSQ